MTGIAASETTSRFLGVAKDSPTTVDGHLTPPNNRPTDPAVGLPRLYTTVASFITKGQWAISGDSQTF